MPTYEAPKIEVHDGKVYATAVYRGTSYCLHIDSVGWCASTRRLALGRHNFGGFRRFESLADAQRAIPPFAVLKQSDFDAPGSAELAAPLHAVHDVMSAADAAKAGAFEGDAALQTWAARCPGAIVERIELH